ncbi:MAG: bifunctional phosphoribosyl-AMP cyclohydrolase/phosphoribosyl-ATP diphosphatase HisIE [Thermoproteota archaeon]
MVLTLNDSKIEDFVKRVNFEKCDGLVPVVVQDASNDKVLMQAFMNEKSLRRTLKTGKMCYWTRTRGRLWVKGEQSGHHSLVQNVILDCNNDALLFKVQQIGVVCHTGKETCFHKPVGPIEETPVDAKILERIQEVILERVRTLPERSYVAHLTDKGEDATLQKIGEETTELILATKENEPEEIVHEATDILFHILVLLAQKDLKLTEIFEELERRHKKKT